MREICPAAPGAKDWQPSAFSPRTACSTSRINNLCMDVEATQANYIAGTPYVGANVKMYAGPGRQSRRVHGVGSGERRKEVWAIKENFPVWSGAVGHRGRRGLLRHDGWLVQGGRREDRRRAVAVQDRLRDHRPADRSTADRTASSTSPILSGVGGWAGAIVAGELDPRDGTAALGFVNAMADLPKQTTKGGGMLYVFALP